MYNSAQSCNHECVVKGRKSDRGVKLRSRGSLDDRVVTHDGVPLFGPRVHVAGPFGFHEEVVSVLRAHPVGNAAITLPRVAHD